MVRMEDVSPNNPLGLMRRACDAEYGIVLSKIPGYAIEPLRRKLYVKEPNLREAISSGSSIARKREQMSRPAVGRSAPC